jgi:hypothetical protein
MYKSVERNQAISWNQPKIIGRRLTVFDVVYGIYKEGLNDYMEAFELDRDIVKDAANYCASLECQKDKNGNFCNGCVLNSLKNGWKVDKDEFKEISIDNEKVLIHSKGNSFYLGSMSEYEEDSFGRMGWKIAEDIKIKYRI